MITASAILSASVLIVDDLEANVQLLARMLASAGYTSVTSTTNPFEVCALHRQRRYDLVLLDLQMPGLDGFHVMEGLKELEPEGYLPVLVITAQPEHKLRAFKAGAKDFVSKPFELAEVLARVRNMLEVRLLHKELRRYNEVLEERVLERTADLQQNYLETVYTMTRAAEYKDEDTGAHVRRISCYCRELARMMGQTQDFIDTIFVASPMHDIGKIGVPDQILLKPGGFTPDEWEVMKGHTGLGGRILGDSKSPYLRMGAEIALGHHERWDGGGYPHGRRGEDIPLAARITHFADVYDALRCRRPYKPAVDHLGAVEIMTHGDERVRPEHFDPALTAAFQEHHETFRDIFDAYDVTSEPAPRAHAALP